MIATLNDNLFSKGYRLIKKRLGHANREKIPKVGRDSDAPGGYAGVATVSRPKKGRTAQGGEKRPNAEQSKGGACPRWICGRRPHIRAPFVWKTSFPTSGRRMRTTRPYRLFSVGFGHPRKRGLPPSLARRREKGIFNGWRAT